jgi:glutathione synthase/RimK-type ligase-like ATP-grasp enzyme
MPDNKFDTRITIIGNRGFGFTRNVREKDFRASGSGSINYDLSRIDPQCVQIAFEVTKQIGGQCLAFDFVKTLTGQPRIVEISYCFMAEAVHNCSGHWDNQLNWHEGQMWPQDAILIDMLDILHI